mgnify:CR=1 FL=1
MNASPLSNTTPSESAGSPPVDADIDKFHPSNPSSRFEVAKDDEHNEWFDVVLNQCNISSNNNKYYRLQLLKEVRMVVVQEN